MTLPGVQSQPTVSAEPPPSSLVPPSVSNSSHLPISAPGDNQIPSTSADETPSNSHSSSPSLITLTKVSPDHGPLSGGEEILAVGSGFGAEQQLLIKFGDQQTPIEATFRCPNNLECILPPYHTAGPVIVTLHWSKKSESDLRECKCIFTYEDRSKSDM